MIQICARLEFAEPGLAFVCSFLGKGKIDEIGFVLPHDVELFQMSINICEVLLRVFR